jgi:hypothetical protein
MRHILYLRSNIPFNFSYIPALKCLGEALVEEAKVFLSEFLNLKAVDNCGKVSIFGNVFSFIRDAAAKWARVFLCDLVPLMLGFRRMFAILYHLAKKSIG